MKLQSRANTMSSPASTSPPDQPVHHLTGFPSLPNEIQLRIAYGLDDDNRNGDLMNLALAHPNFVATAQEVLLRNGIVPMRSVSRYTELLSRQPEWVLQKIQLQLGRRNAETNVGRQDARTSMAALSSKVKSAYADLLAEFAEHNGLERAWDEADDRLALLFSMLPNVSELSIRTSFFRNRFIQHLLTVRPSTDFPCGGYVPRAADLIAAHVAKNLRVLDISHDYSSQPQQLDQLKGFINVSDFQNLQRLSIPWELLKVTEYLTRATDPVRLLPQGLERLDIYCNVPDYAPFRWLLVLIEARHRSGMFGPLKAVRLYFKRSLSSCLRPSKEHESFRTGLLALLDVFSLARVALETFFLVDESFSSFEDPAVFCPHSVEGWVEPKTAVQIQRTDMFIMLVRGRWTLC